MLTSHQSNDAPKEATARSVALFVERRESTARSIRVGRWFVLLVLAVLFALPVYAQENTANDAPTTNDTASDTTADTTADTTEQGEDEKTARDGESDAQSKAQEPPAPVVPPADEEDKPAGPPPGVEVMRVKGRAVSGIEADVPESVTQFDASEIAALGAGNIADLAKVTPNVEIRSAGATTATFFIRGVGLSDFSSNAAGAVAIYQDDIALNAPAIQLGQLFDTLTVDVKRGPQGVGLYRNASAGAIMIYAKKPSLEYEASLRSSTGSFWSKDARNAFIRDTEGAVNVPLIEDTLAARVAFRVRATDPYMTNGCGNASAFKDREIFDPFDSSKSLAEVAICGERDIDPFEFSRVPPGLPTKIGNRSDWDARGALRFSPPGTKMDWLLNLHGGRLDQDSTLGQTIGTSGLTGGRFGDVTSSGYYEPDQFKEFQEIKFDIANVSSEQEFTDIPDAKFKRDTTREAGEKLSKKLSSTRPLDRKPYRGDYNKVGQTTRDTFGGYLRGELPIGDKAQFRTITGFETYKRFRDSDPDFTPDILFESVTEDDAHQFTQDFLLTGAVAEGAVRWSTGFAYLEEKLNNLSLTDANTAFPDPIRREYTQETSAYMVFAQVGFDFLEDFTLDVGARFNYEHKDFEISEIVIFPTAGGINFGKETWKEPTGRIALTYHLTDTSSIFAKYTRGYKAGHFNSNSRIEATDPGPARPEFIDSFEWGFTASFLEGRVKSAGNFFYYRYKDYQVFIFRDNPGVFDPPSLVIRNAEGVQQYGLELDVSVEPLKDYVADEFDNLKFGVRFGWLESRFLQFTNIVFRTDPDNGQNFALVLDFAGNQLINSPKFKISGNIEWPLELGEFGTLTPRYFFEWSDDIFFDANEGRGSLDLDGIPVQPSHALGQRAHWIHNIRVSYLTPVGNVEVSGWVRNILDQRTKTYAFDASFFARTVINFVADPRSAGADVKITW